MPPVTVSVFHGAFSFPWEPSGGTVYHLYAVRFEDRDRIRRALADRGVS